MAEEFEGATVRQVHHEAGNVGDQVAATFTLFVQAEPDLGAGAIGQPVEAIKTNPV